MRDVKYKELKDLKEFEEENGELVWCPFDVDHFMGFTICRIRAVEGDNGLAFLKYTEQYVMSGRSPEKECTDNEYINRMQNALEKLLVNV